MNKLEQYKTWLRAHEDIFIDLVRIYLGCGLFVKAFYLMGNRDYLLEAISDTGGSWFGPAVIAQYVITAHLIGGAMLALGLVTRLAALMQLPVLLGAVFAVYLPRMASMEPRQNLEYAALVCFLLALFSVFGAGRFSVDSMIARKWRELKGEDEAMAPVGESQ